MPRDWTCGGGRDATRGSQPGCAQGAQLPVEQLVFLVEQLALAIELQNLLVKFFFLFLEGRQLLLNGGAQLLEIIGGGIRKSPAGQSDQKRSAKQERRRGCPKVALQSRRARFSA